MYPRRQDPPKISLSRALEQVKRQTGTVSHFGIMLALTQAAASMALEGRTRASVTEIVERAQDECGIEVLLSTAGQKLSADGIRTVTSHGKNRLVLVKDELLELRDQYAAIFNQLSKQAEEYLARFKPVSERVAGLEEQRQNVVRMVEREAELREFLQGKDRLRFSYQGVANEAAQLKKTVDAIRQLREDIEELKVKAKGRSSLEKRKAKLKEAEAEYERESSELAKLEKDLGSGINKVKEGREWYNLSMITTEVERAQAELDELSRQLGEKRSLVQKLLGRGG